jgi:Mn2+/Fe2+ NRAMP family transporter
MVDKGQPHVGQHRHWLMVVGPGLLVMLADNDAGSLITEAKIGSQWGYKFLALQFLLIPVLYLIQELCVRLGLVTGKGFGELIRDRFGLGWAWLSAATLAITCIGALIAQLSGIAGVAALIGLSAPVVVATVIGLILLKVWTGSYASVERIAIAFGLFELAFIMVAWRAGAHAHQILRELDLVPLGNPKLSYMVAANLGAVIIPWMIYYQQSAVIDKGLQLRDLKIARIDTAIGAVITQVISAAVIITTAATLHQASPNTPLNDVPQIAHAITPFLGDTVGRLVFAAGMVGAAFVATVVVCLAAAWGIGEVAGFKRSLEHEPLEAPWFYSVFSLCLIGSGLVVLSGVNLVDLSIGVEVMNALLLPIVLGFLFLLAAKALPEPHLLKGVYGWVAGIVFAVTAGLGAFGGLYGVFGG